MGRLTKTLASLVVGATALSTVQADQPYDVIIVGSGPGALIAAEFISRDPNVSVLILEAGLPSVQDNGGTNVPSFAASKGWTQFDIPGEYENTIYNSANEKYRVDWINEPGMWLGKLVGGSSSVNAALYFRPPDAYVTNSKWPTSPQRVAALLDENEQIHGATDMPSPDGKYYTQEAYNIVAKAFKSIGYSEKTINDAAARNAKHKSFGHAPYTFKNGMRDVPAKAFWNRMKSRSNVKLVTSAMVDYIKQWQGKAVSVVYNSNVEAQLTSRGAVIMGAGALSTPKLLMQSGVGPQDQLDLLNARNFGGVKFSANGGWVVNNNVGKSLFDTNVVFAVFSHPDMKSFRFRDRPSDAINQYLQSQTGAYTSPGPVMIGYETMPLNGRNYECQMTVLVNGFGDFYSQGNTFTTSLYVNNPESRDYCSFGSDGSYRAFTQHSTYMAAPNDLSAMQNYAQHVVDTLKASGASFLSTANGQSVASWVSDHRSWYTHHFGGTCYTTSDTSDSKRCADTNLRVLGTSNIFIGDGSAMKEGTVNPYGFIMYIGREVGDQVKSYLASNPPTPSSCSIEEGIDYVGNDVGSRASSTAEGCCTICQGFNGCNAFTWSNYAGGTCWLKSARGATKVTSGVRSARVNSATCSIEENVDYAGNDIGNVPGGSAEACCQICTDRAGCQAYSWNNYNGGTCWLKSAKGATSSKAGVRSAVIGATTPPPPVSSCPVVEKNIDYVGNDLTSVASANADGCCDLCGQNKDCAAYTWTNYQSGTCWLKTAKGATASISGAVSAVYKPNGCTLAKDVDYYGNDLTSVASPTAGGCCSACRQRARNGCTAFTWANTNGGTCYLKTTQGSPVTKTGAISGVISMAA